MCTFESVNHKPSFFCVPSINQHLSGCISWECELGMATVDTVLHRNWFTTIRCNWKWQFTCLWLLMLVHHQTQVDTKQMTCTFSQLASFVFSTEKVFVLCSCAYTPCILLVKSNTNIGAGFLFDWSWWYILSLDRCGGINQSCSEPVLTWYWNGVFFFSWNEDE